MVDVTKKGETVREAVAKGRIRVSAECFEKIKRAPWQREMYLAWPGLPGSWEPSVLQS